MTDHQRNENVEVEAAEESRVDADVDSPVDAAADSEEAPQYGVGPFTVREVALVGVWIVAFIVSFFSVFAVTRGASLTGGGTSVWTSGLEWVLAIGLPTVAVFLIVLRRFSPDGIRRVGSLAVDQFASVAFSVAAMVWFTWLWANIARAISTGVWVYSWVVWVEFFLMLAGVVLTVFAPFIAPLDQDFLGRPEIVAHRNARPVRAVTRRPAPAPRPEPEPEPVEDDSTEAAAYAAVAEQEAYAAYAGYDAQPVAQSAEPEPTVQFTAVEPERARQQAFWALAPEERNVVDESGIPIFRIGPTAWALVIEDRGEVFVVRHEDGRIGYLHDVEGVTRG